MVLLLFNVTSVVLVIFLIIQQLVEYATYGFHKVIV
jgi:hypothetical protein